MAREKEARETEARLLVVEDDANIREMLVASLRFSGFEVDSAPDGLAGLAAARRQPPDLIVLDVMLPGLDGFAVAERLRADRLSRRGAAAAPILFLTARDAVEDRVRGLDLGGDDYLTKPFSLVELVARVRAILRRTHAGFRINNDDGRLLRVGDLELDEQTNEVTRAGIDLALTPTEYELLRYLMENAGQVVSKAQILDHVWQYSFGGDANIVESYISYLRRKVDAVQVVDSAGGKSALPPLIHTKRGFGYLLRAPEGRAWPKP